MSQWLIEIIKLKRKTHIHTHKLVYLLLPLFAATHSRKCKATQTSYGSSKDIT